MRNLAGTFRVHDREVQAMVGMRSWKQKFSMNQIAKILDRSRSTVHKYVSPIDMDNRRNSHRARIWNNSRFNYLFNVTRLKVKMYLDGLFTTIKEALEANTIPMATLDFYFTTENSSDEEDEEPA